ncbi:hypothetical protein OROHE_005586 [Orobanche hederae]
MQPPRHHSRINLADLKAQIVKKLGLDGSKQYFYYLNSFLNLKLNKFDFNKLCLKILGRDNVPLHNQLIRSILRNACTAKSPTQPLRDGGYLNPGPKFIGKDISVGTYQQNGTGFSNGGDMLLPPSPKKARTGLRERRGGDRRSALGLNGKTSFALHSSNVNAVLENGGSTPTQYGFLHQSENKNEIMVPKAANSPVESKCSDFSAPLCSEYGQNLVVTGEGKDSLPQSPIRAPLGVPFCPASVGGAHWSLVGSGRCVDSVLKDGVLLDSVSLRERMEEIALAQGLEGVSLDSANILNHGLDSYMKRLIRSCIEIVGSRKEGSEITGNNNNNNNNNNISTNKQQRNREIPISLRDFRVAMEMNPRKLGEDWPLLLERICTNSFEE